MSLEKLTDIFIYPVKGMRGIRVEEAQVLSAGIQYDRRWMLVDEKGNFLSQRTSPTMAEFETGIVGDNCIISYKGETIVLPLSLTDRDVKTKVSVWKSKLYAYESRPQISAWFSERLDIGVRMVYKPDEVIRNRRLFVSPFLAPVSLADGYPLLILGTTSVEHLNSKLENAITADRFRANLLVKTNSPHVEDEWGTVMLGNSELKVIKPCARCMVVNIDQKSGELSKEPLKTLATYRKKKTKVMFGANTIVIKEGTIAVGDELKLAEA